MAALKSYRKTGRIPAFRAPARFEIPLAQVEQVALSVPDVQTVDRLRVRWLGHALEASMAITVDCDMTVSEGHRVSEEVRHRLVHEVPKLDMAVIHVNPCAHDGQDAHELTRHHDALPGHADAEGAAR